MSRDSGQVDTAGVSASNRYQDPLPFYPCCPHESLQFGDPCLSATASVFNPQPAVWYLAPENSYMELFQPMGSLILCDPLSALHSIVTSTSVHLLPCIEMFSCSLSCGHGSWQDSIWVLGHPESPFRNWVPHNQHHADTGIRCGMVQVSSWNPQWMSSSIHCTSWWIQACGHY